MSRHTKLFGSTSYRTLNCPAHYQRGLHLPEPPTSPAAEEGTMLHGICEDVLKRPDMLPEDHPKWDDLDYDQQRIVWHHVEFVRDLAKGGKLLVEFRTECPHLHPEWFGTADAVIIKPPRLTIADLKCGRIGVEVEDDKGDINAQLASYAIGVLETLPRDVVRQIREVELVVIQPRNGGFKRRLVNLAELKAMKARLLEAGRLAESANPPASAGPWCKFCKAKATCPTVRERVFEQAKLDFAFADEDPQKLTRADIAEILSVAELAKDWIASVETLAAQMLSEDSEAVEGWELVPKRATRKWAAQPSDITSTLTAQGLRLSDITKTEILSPSQIEQVARKQGIEIDLTGLTKAESSGMKLARKEHNDDEFDGGW